MKKNLKIVVKRKAIEITPSSFMCAAAMCPAVYLLKGDSKIAIVGKRTNAAELGIEDKVGKDEEVVIVDREMLRQIFEK